MSGGFCSIATDPLVWIGCGLLAWSAGFSMALLVMGYLDERTDREGFRS